MEQEEAWLKAMRAAQDDNMYNLKNSYHGKLGANPSKATRDKLSKAGKGRKTSEETKRKMSEAATGRVNSAEMNLLLEMAER